MATRPRHVWNWLRILKSAFCRPQGDPRFVPQLDALEDRCCPAVFQPSLFAFDGDAGSLRDAVIQANANTATSNTIFLQAGQYNLGISNDGTGQENAAARGDLDLTAAGKTYLFKGQGQTATSISGNFIDRVFQIFPGVNVEFRNLTIMFGQASDDGTPGSGLVPGDARGGGVLNSGGTVLFRNVALRSNFAQADVGINGSPGLNGTAGFRAQGGALYSDGGTITLNGGTTITSSSARGEVGGAGGAGGPMLSAGSGGAGSVAQGGGAYLFGTRFTLTDRASVVDNLAIGGGGGLGGAGNDTVPGGTGGAGGIAQGGGLYAESSSVKIDTDGAFDRNNVFAGAAGQGGTGSPSGGSGGQGGTAQGGGIFATNGSFALARSRVTNGAAVGGQGGPGGQGARADRGGVGGAGGVSQGAGLYLDVVAPRISQAKVSLNQVVGGRGGRGGDGAFTGTGSNFTGGVGGAGGVGQGAGLFVAGASAALLKGLTVSANNAFGGAGGQGGNGGFNNANNNGLFGGAGGLGALGQGAGLYQAAGATTILRSTFNNNQLVGGTGGFGGNGGSGANGNGSNASLRGGDASDANDAQGAGLYNAFAATLTLINATVSSNRAFGGQGGFGGNGGVAFDTSMGGAVTASTIGPGGDGGASGNSRGGGLYNAGGTLNLYNSTIAFNETFLQSGGFGGPGNPNGNFGNFVGRSEGGGVFDAGVVFAFSTIFANNTAFHAGPDFFGDLEASRCLFSNSAGVNIVGGTGPNFLDVDPQLRELSNNGGPTFTHALSNTSPAINRGFNPLNLANDQRGPGFLRTLGGFTDIGALENGSGVTQPVAPR